MHFLTRFIIIAFALCSVTAVSAQEITKKRGKYKIYFDSGKVKAKGKVKNYHKNGEWKYYDEEGHVVTVAHYQMDTIDGAYTDYFPDGKISVSGTYCKNRKCGNWRMYDSEGHRMSDENMNYGLQDGPQRFWYPNGRLRDSLQFSNGVIQYRKAWFSNGKVKAIETYRDGLAEGKWVVYKDPGLFQDTLPEYTDEYHLGKKHGWHYLWNGASLIEAYHYQDGLPDGTFTRYAYDGKPVLIQNYSKGKLNGTTTFYKDGKKLKEENYSDDVKEGMQLEYDRNETVSKCSWYDNGFLDSMNVYHANGKVAINRIYGRTNDKSYYMEYDSSGVLLMKGLMHNELRIGEWKTYYPNGQVRSTTNYEEGKIVGLYTKYYPNGKKMIQYTFLPIGTNTMPDVWDEKGKPIRMGTKAYEEIVEGNKAGEIFSDPSEYHREIIDHRINE